jgi:phosphate-selective porin OprO and OprP
VKPLAILLACLVTPAVALAQGDQKPAAPPPSAFDRVWSHLTNWYDNQENPAIQRVLFTGRFQHDLALVDADQGDHNESNVRRLRFGPRITFARDFLFHLEVEVNPQEHNPFYMRITDLYLAWQKHPKSVIQVGKQSVPFTQEGATSSKELLTIDRSNLANNIWFTQEYMPGVSLSGRMAPWSYRAGVYSSGAMNRELGKFNGDQFALFAVGYDFAKKMHVTEATLTGNYLYQHPDINNTFTKRWEHVGSVHFKLEQPQWGVRGDVSRTAGYLGQSNVVGVMAMPSYNFTKKLQAIARFTLLNSDADNGLVLNTYENRVVTGRGDQYRETYLGLNYFIYGHRLKVQTGVQFEEMKDAANDGGAFSGTSWTTGLRIGW